MFIFFSLLYLLDCKKFGVFYEGYIIIIIIIGLTLEASASESLYGGQFTLSNQLIKPNYLVILPPTQHHSFFRNLPPLFFI